MAEVDIERLCSAVSGIVASDTDDGRTVKVREFERLIEMMMDDDSRSRQPFNWADAFCVAHEAKALGLLSTREDAELLIETAVRITSTPAREIREDVLLSLKSREFLDSRSAQVFANLCNKLGPTKAARRVGISIQTLDKLIGGGWSGPLFQHMPVSAATIKKARAFLATNPEI